MVRVLRQTVVAAFVAALAVMALLAFSYVMPAAVAQTADPVAADPRFTLQPVNGGMLKLDTRSGALSFCSMKSGAWVCEAVPEDRAALEGEIARLNARIAELEKGRAGGVPDIMGAPVPPQMSPPAVSPPAASPPAAAPPADGEGSGTAEAQKRLDQAMDMAEHAFRRFFDMVERLRGREPAPQEQSL